MGLPYLDGLGRFRGIGKSPIDHEAVVTLRSECTLLGIAGLPPRLLKLPFELAFQVALPVVLELAERVLEGYEVQLLLVSTPAATLRAVSTSPDAQPAWT